MVQDVNFSPRRLRIRMTAGQHRELQGILFPGDGLEAVAIALCGRGGSGDDQLMLVHEVVEVPKLESQRYALRVTWQTSVLAELLPKLAEQDLGLLKIHSHPTGFGSFSQMDDAADEALFPGVYAWSGSNRPHVSAIMLPGGSVIARVVTDEGQAADPVEVQVIGDSIVSYSGAARSSQQPTHLARTAQAFGSGTVARLGALSVGVVGCSGTGSWVVELLLRLGVRELVLIDPDVVEFVNLNRIVHATTADAEAGTPKVEVLSRAIRNSGLPVEVEAMQSDIHEPRAVRRVARCDVVFGCVDSVDARELLSRVSTYYIMPYFDVGVRLVADGSGGVSHVVGAVNYVHPENPSLIDRGLYTPKQLADAGLRRSDPTAYSKQVDAGYIRGAAEARPAVASVNAFYASLAVNELMERLHPFRDTNFPRGVMISLSQLRILDPAEGAPDPTLAKRTGRGDCVPLLGMPVLS